MPEEVIFSAAFQSGRRRSFIRRGKAIFSQHFRGYAGNLMDKGIPADKIRSYGFAFEGKMVLIREAREQK